MHLMIFNFCFKKIKRLSGNFGSVQTFHMTLIPNQLSEREKQAFQCILYILKYQNIMQKYFILILKYT